MTVDPEGPLPNRYRKKPVVIEAMQWMPELMPGEGTTDDVFAWGDKYGVEMWRGPAGKSLVIRTLEGDMVAQPCDFIIKGVQGEFYPCKPDIFEATYEPA